MNIRREAFRFADVVGRFVEHVRAFFYEAVLCGRVCPKCEGALRMAGEGRAVCANGHRVDPTAAFQACSECGGKPRLRIRHYECHDCGALIRSRFLFDGLVFDAAYFKRKMSEHRERESQRRERVRQMLAVSRSDPLQNQAADLTSVPGLIEALNGLVSGATDWHVFDARASFDLERYQSHIRSHIGPNPMAFDDIAPLSDNARLDRIWRFIALIFLAHAGLVRLEQQDGQIMIHETHPERRDIPGDLEAVDGIEGVVG